ncbi:MAG: PD-(D/E)XK nuclease family protein [Candidatus Saccharibacteria bacterium]
MTASNSPYPLKDINHLSASAISDYAGNCEARSAYGRNSVGAPEPDQPAAAAYGTAIHALCDRFCRQWWRKIRETGQPLNFEDVKGQLRYGMLYVADALSEQRSARGEGQRVEKIRWMTEAEKASLSPEEYRKLVKEKIGQYQGRAYNALAAVALEYTVPLPFSHMVFEYNFNGLKITVGKTGTPWRIRLEGQIDRIRYSPIGYDVTDYKTGYVISEYEKRKKLAEDIQMTVYNLVMLKKTGRQPREMFIQPLELRKEFREKHLDQTLPLLRKPVPIRTEAHFRDLNLLVSDLLRMIDFVVHADRYSQAEREDWQPESVEAQKLDLRRNVLEARFIPRIGSWCQKACPRYEVCQKDYAADWAEYRLRYGSDPDEGVQSPLPLPPPRDDRETQGELFERLAKRSPYQSKKNRVLKREMVASGDFFPKIRLRGIETPSVKGSLVEEIQKALLADGHCPCTKFQLTPRFALENLGLIKDKLVTIRELAKYCPCEYCPRRDASLIQPAEPP